MARHLARLAMRNQPETLCEECLEHLRNLIAAAASRNGRLQIETRFVQPLRRGNSPRLVKEAERATHDLYERRIRYGHSCVGDRRPGAPRPRQNVVSHLLGIFDLPNGGDLEAGRRWRLRENG